MLTIRVEFNWYLTVAIDNSTSLKCLENFFNYGLGCVQLVSEDPNWLSNA